MAGEDLVFAGAAALFVGGAHMFTHGTLGDEDSFDDAGVVQAGFAVMVATFVATWALLNFTQLRQGIPGVPAEAIAVTAVVFIGAVMVMNRGNPWFINVRAQKEPAVLALGFGLMVFMPNSTGFVLGGFLIALGLISRFTDRIDL